MRKSLGLAIAAAMFFLASASWAQLDLNADPRWRALMSGPLDTDVPVATRPAKSPGGLKSFCSATAECGGGGTVSCNGTGTCTAVDQNLPSQQGYVTCNSVTTYCPDCDHYDRGSCDYSWDPGTQCCVASADGFFCPYACFGS